MRSFYLLTIFASSFLLFLVQPMLAKAILPLVGGAPAVWIIVMLFFQILLLAGYGYAALTSKYLTARNQARVHIALYVVAVAASLPLTLQTHGSSASQYPEVWVMTTLLLTIGLPYFILSAHSSLLQRWYHDYFGTDPYRLFSASNAGSLLGLFGYPFLVEWLLPLPEQMHYWGIGFLLVAIMVGAIGWKLKHADRDAPILQSPEEALPIITIAKVIFAGFAPSSLFLGVILFVTTDIAALPLIWIVPLALYLISFILVFSRFGEEWTKLAQKIHPVMILVFFGLMAYTTTFTIFAHFLIFFVIAISCHGEAMRMKPPAKSLTSYFFWLSFGGALGGLFNALAPHIFSGVWEYPLVILLSIFALPAKFLPKNKNVLYPAKFSLIVAFMIMLIAAIQFTGREAENPDKQLVHQSRNFFGVSKVEKTDKVMRFMHGTTTHGVQSLDEKDRLNPVSYYAPIKELIKLLPPTYYAHPFGVLGLGAGTTACYGKAGQTTDFFEIDQAVIDIANNPAYFTYLRDCGTNISIFKGDGRLELAKHPDHRYNLLVMDAFTSDAVPLHLLTYEALGIYISKTMPKSGIIAFNISNRHFNLAPFIAKSAQAQGWKAYRKLFKDYPENSLVYQSDWLLVIPPDSLWMKQIEQTGFKTVETSAGTALWTDNYSNILNTLIW
jgi:hypothetical protein